MTLSGQAYRCSAGETFDSVALLVYGDEKFACELLTANPAVCTRPVFTGGEILDLPVVEMPDVDGYEGTPTKAPWKEA